MIRKFLCIGILCGAISYVGAAFPPYEAKDFSYLQERAGKFSKDLLSMHFKLYQGYVANANKLLETIAKMEQEGKERSYEYGALKRRLGWEIDGMLLHELYFQNMGGGGVMPEGPLKKAIVAQFGSVELWQKAFIASGMIRGVGWVILYQNPKDGRLFNLWINEQDVGHLAGGKPLLVMDVWEHAYIPQFGLDREKYIELFFDTIDWQVVGQRFIE